MKLAILIPTTPDRAPYMSRLVPALRGQIEASACAGEVEIIVNEDNYEKTTGTKRNELIQTALEREAEYIAFFDSDDMPGPTYVSEMLKGIAEGCDCCSLTGQIYWSRVPGKPFFHSIKFTSWWEDGHGYYRCPNHLNCIRLALVRDVRFKDISSGEDADWSFAIQKSGVLKNEYEIKDVIYHYYCGEK